MQEKTWLTPGAIGFLCAMGLKKVVVYDKPKITLVVTGNELQQVGEPLKMGKVYDSNSYTLIAAVENTGLKIVNSSLVKDRKAALIKALKGELGKTDVLLISGGVSVGKYDLVEEVLNELGATTIFHNVAQRPGKPLYFGKFKNTLIFGLPGNPSSALTCFYEYVLPALNKLRGKGSPFLKPANYKLMSDFKTVPHLSYFVRGKLSNEGVKPLEGFESYKMKAFADADCLIYLPKGKELWQSGETVEVHLLF
jgi:molybdopterin molybdotransferase